MAGRRGRRQAELIDLEAAFQKLGTSVREFILARDAEMDSSPMIADKLFQLGGVRVTERTVQRWLNRFVAERDACQNGGIQTREEATTR